MLSPASCAWTPLTRNGSGASGSFVAASSITAKALAGTGRRLRDARAISVIPRDNSAAGWLLQNRVASDGRKPASALTAAFLTTCVARRIAEQATTIVLKITPPPSVARQPSASALLIPGVLSLFGIIKISVRLIPRPAP